jgi:hypothetical protein
LNNLQINPNKLVSVRVVEEPAQNALQNMAANYYASRGYINSRFNEEQAGLRAKYRPAKFSGPSQLEQLNGKCFEHISKK